jgi:hypothetical protein
MVALRMVPFAGIPAGDDRGGTSSVHAFDNSEATYPASIMKAPGRLRKFLHRHRWARRCLVVLFFPAWLIVDVGGFVIDESRDYFRELWP